MGQGELSQQRISYGLRGPELGFVIPRGDISALASVARNASEIWNGANALVIPVSEGTPEMDPATGAYTAIRDVETVFYHSAFSAAAIRELFPRINVQQIHPKLTDWYLHPLNLWLSGDSSSKYLLTIPSVNEDPLPDVETIIWGSLNPGDRGAYEEAFSLRAAPTELAAKLALLDGQTSGVSPLAQSVRLIDLHEQVSPAYDRFIYVVQTDSFDDLCTAWNYRSRVVSWGSREQLIIMPVGFLKEQAVVAEMVKWIAAESRLRQKPDVRIFAAASIRDSARQELVAAGMVEVPEETRTEQLRGPAASEQRALEFAFAGYLPGGQLRRGLFADDLAALRRGENTMRFGVPKGFAAKYSNSVVLEVTWPNPFPVTRSAAAKIQQNGYAYQGRFCIRTQSPSRSFDLKLRVLDPDEALNAYMQDLGLSAEITPPGRFARAVIDRVGGLEGLSVLTNTLAIAIFENLASLARRKVEASISKALKDAKCEEPEGFDRFIQDTVKNELILLRPNTKTLDDIASQIGFARADIAPLLERLLATGLVRRGRTYQCEECGAKEFYPISDLDDVMRCLACRAEFTLPLLQGDGLEAKSYLRLDGLAETMMDNDLLPVLAAVRRFTPRDRSALQMAYWPGLDVTVPGAPTVDFDVFFGFGPERLVAECKRTADSLKLDQATRIVEMARRIGAQVYFCALKGSFSDELLDYGMGNGAEFLVGEGLLRV